MRILYVLNSGQPGGMEYHVLDLVRGMSKLGHKVFVWCNHGHMINLYESAGAVVNVVPIKYDISPSYINLLVKFLKAQSIDIVHTHELKAGVNAMLASSLAKVKVCVTHTHTPISEWRVNSVVKYIDQKVYTFCVNNFSSMEIALTESRRMVKMEEGISKTKLTIIPNGIDTTRFEFSKEVRDSSRREMASKYKFSYDSFVLGCVSRLTSEKGTQVLLSAFSNLILQNRIPKTVTLVLAGGGVLEDQLRKNISDMNLTSHVIVTGIFPHSDLIKLYASFDAFVFPSLAEGFGIVLLEAMAARLPIICSDLPVLREVGSESVFSYFQSGNVTSLEEALLSLVNSPRTLEFGDYAFERAHGCYTLDRFTTAYTALYSTLLEGAK